MTSSKRPRWPRSFFLGMLLVAGLFGAPSGTLTPPTADAAPANWPPNILFVIIDDIGIDQMRVFGYDKDNQPHTPTIDTIALAGIRFRNAWAMPECSPSRVSFFTGRYPMRTGVVNISLDNTLANSQMSPFEFTTPKVLKAQGYRNGFFGKWHLTAFPSNNQQGLPNPGNPSGNAAPRDLGWDYFEGMLEGSPRGIDSTAGGVAAPGTYACGFVNDASFGACYNTDGTCAPLGDPADPPSSRPGRSCLEKGGILVPGEACQATVPANVSAGFEKFNGYYVAPLLINREDGSVEVVAGFQADGSVKPPTDPRARGYLTTAQTDAAIKWIKQQSPGTPWMATLSYSAAHLPAQQPPAKLLPNPALDGSHLQCDREVPDQRQLTNFMVEALDRELRRLLVETGLATETVGGGLTYRPDATNTMIVIVGDNGSYVQTVRLPFDPTRGKGTVYQTGVWVPLIVSGPLVNPANAGREVPHMVNAAVDLFALFGEVAGVNVHQVVPRSRALDAQPLMPYLSNPKQRSIRANNFTQTGTVLSAPGDPLSCVITIGPDPDGRAGDNGGGGTPWRTPTPGFEVSGGMKICTEILTFADLCLTEGGQPYPGQTCCDVQAEDETVTILPHAVWAIRDDQFKLVRTERENCTTKQFELTHEFYAIDEAAPLPNIDYKNRNLLSSPTLPPAGLTGVQRGHFNKLFAQLDGLLSSETACPGDGNLDKRVDQADLANWQQFADLCLADQHRCSSVYDMNFDAITDEADRDIIVANVRNRCPVRGLGH